MLYDGRSLQITAPEHGEIKVDEEGQKKKRWTGAEHNGRGSVTRKERKNERREDTQIEVEGSFGHRGE